MDANRQLQVVPDREPMTELEARRVGETALRLAQLRALLRHADSGGSITAGAGYTAQSRFLGSADLQAALAFLIERDEMFLASFNIKIERPTE